MLTSPAMFWLMLMGIIYGPWWSRCQVWLPRNLF